MRVVLMVMGVTNFVMEMMEVMIDMVIDGGLQVPS